MSKRRLQIYEIGEEEPEKDESVTVDLNRYKTLADIVPELPPGLTKVQEEIWKLKNKKK